MVVDPAPGDDDGLSILGSFIDPTADSLLAKVDFLGLIATFGKAGVGALIIGLVSIPLALAGAFEELVDALGFTFLEAPAIAFQQSLVVVQTRAVAVAAGDLGVFELFALPASAVAALGPIVVVAVVAALVLGGEP